MAGSCFGEMRRTRRKKHRSGRGPSAVAVFDVLAKQSFGFLIVSLSDIYRTAQKAVNGVLECLRGEF